MKSHIIIEIMLCALQCEPVQVGVWDGDTIRIERIRIFNIDAPELDGKCEYEIDLAYSAKTRLANILDGQRVQFQWQGKTVTAGPWPRFRSTAGTWETSWYAKGLPGLGAAVASSDADRAIFVEALVFGN